MKRVAVFGSIGQFEDFVNDPKVSIIDVKVNSCEQSYNFQEYFIGVVFYEDAPQNTKELAATDNQQLKQAIALLSQAAAKYLTGVYESREFLSHLQSIEQRACV